jgi:SAM-dependent methyltransferase
MMLQNKSLKKIWNENQKLLPTNYKTAFEKTIGYCLHEKKLKEDLILDGNKDIWESWKYTIRPQVIKNRSKKYSSINYMQQRKVEYDRRAKKWYELIENLIKEEGIPDGAHLVDIGANDGDEVCRLPFIITCVDPSIELFFKGKWKHDFMDFKVGTADSSGLQNSAFDVYLSLRTWCVAGVLPDEAFKEAKRILKSNGLLMVSFPLKFKTEEKTLETAVADKIKLLCDWTYSLFEKNLVSIKTYSAPEDFFIYGRLRKE